jgi:hypothetical protein
MRSSAAATFVFYISFSFKQPILFRIKFCSTTTTKNAEVVQTEIMHS